MRASYTVNWMTFNGDSGKRRGAHLPLNKSTSIGHPAAAFYWTDRRQHGSDHGEQNDNY
jgi:hypothetical protein